MLIGWGEGVGVAEKMNDPILFPLHPPPPTFYFALPPLQSQRFQNLEHKIVRENKAEILPTKVF